MAIDDFETAYRHLFPRAAVVAYRLLGDKAAAEDIAAEALARAYAHWSRIAYLPHRDGWVLRVATNLAIDAARHRPRRVVESEPLDAEAALIVRTALVAALRSLPRRQRQVVAMRYLSDMREDEVAAALGVSPSTAGTHLRRGLDALRRDLGEGFRMEGLADERV